MPDKRTIRRALADKRAGKAASTQAGEFVREEIHKVRRGQHGARSPQQAIAIGLSKARRAGIKLPPPKKGRTSKGTRAQAQRDLAKGRSGRRGASRTRSRATSRALRRESSPSASRPAISRQARSARRRGSTARRSAARKAALTRRRHR